jgi:hypothetical protein
MTYKKLLDIDGEDKFFRKIIEELNELASAISHYQDGKVDVSKVIDEHSDVLLQLEKLEYFITQHRENYHGCVYNSYLVKKKNLNIYIEKNK